MCKRYRAIIHSKHFFVQFVLFTTRNNEHFSVQFSPVGFDSQLLVMSSMRKPKRIKMFGSDGKEVMFLVKGGEDLRNDERIELLFGLMNTVVSSASSTSTSTSTSNTTSFEEECNISQFSRLQARTYIVIPMTSQVGILEWVSNTVPVKLVVSEEMSKDAQFCSKNESFNTDKDITQTEAFQVRYDWVNGHEAPKYHKMIRDASQKSANEVYAKMKSLLPDDFIRRRLLRVAESPESFITLRTEYSKSLAVSSLFGYILGLGDRHLENLLLDTRTGGIVQIDFGYCFGMGQSIVPVPEFIPFRLTPQLIGVLQPLDGTVLLRHYMVRAMSHLRSDDGVQVLSNALQVYVNDPLLDWIGNSDEKDDEPKRKVESCVRKLKGVDPGLIILEDLALNETVKREKSLPALKAIITRACLKGISGGQSTSTAALKCSVAFGGCESVLTVDQQIDALIALSTDPDVTVRQWVGLATWI